MTIEEEEENFIHLLLSAYCCWISTTRYFHAFLYLIARIHAWKWHCFERCLYHLRDTNNFQFLNIHFTTFLLRLKRNEKKKWMKLNLPPFTLFKNKVSLYFFILWNLVKQVNRFKCPKMVAFRLMLMYWSTHSAHMFIFLHFSIHTAAIVSPQVSQTHKVNPCVGSSE